MNPEGSPAQTTTRRRNLGRRTLVAILAVVASIAGLLSVGVSPAAASDLDSLSITSQSPALVVAGAVATYQLTVRGDDNDRYKLSISYNGTTPSGVSFSPTSCLQLDGSQDTFTFTISTTAATPGGSYPFTVTARRYSNSGCTTSTSDTVSDTETLAVAAAPTITSVNSATFTAGSAGSFTVTSTGNPARTYSATPLPTGVTINASSGVLTSTTATEAGTYSLTITASNGVNPAATQPFTLNVNKAPVITSGNMATFTAGTTDTFTVTSTGNPARTYSATPLPTGVTINTSSGALTSTTGAAAGTYNFTITAANGVSPAATQPFTLRILGPVTQLVFTTQPTTVVAGALIAPAVQVAAKDTNGNVVTTDNATTVTVGIGANPGTGALSGTLTQTVSSGVATFNNLAINKTGTGYTLSATSNPAHGTATSDTFNVTPGLVTQLVITTQPANVVAGASIAPGVQVSLKDFNGNVVTSDNATTVTVGIGANPGTGALSGTLTRTVSSGVATFSNLSINKTGIGYTLTATSNPAHGTATSGTFNVTPGSAASLTLVPATTAPSAGAADNLTISASDAFGNTATGYSGSKSLTFSGASSVGSNNPTVVDSLGVARSFGAATPISFTDGIATVVGPNNGVMVLYKPETVNIVVADVTSAINNGAGVSVTVSPAAANKLAFVLQPTDALRGTAMASAVTVQVQDQFGNSVNSNASVGLSLLSGTISSGGGPVSAAGGLATFNGLTISTAGSGLTLSATSSGLTSATANPFTVSVLVANGATLTDNATDAGSGVASVTYSYCLGFSGSCPAGTLIGSSSTSAGNFPLTWNAQPANDQYRVVAAATDNAGNSSGPSTSIPVTIFNQAPSITSANSTTFSLGSGNSFTVTAAGTPAPTLSQSGSLPTGVTFNTGTGVLSGTPAAGTAGNYSLSFTATNGVTPNSTQSFTLTVGQAPVITSVNSTTFTVGAPGSFTVTATGTPTPTFSATGTLPNGVTRTAGTLSGTPAAGTAGSYPITITATNVAGTVNQSFTLTISSPAALTVTSITSSGSGNVSSGDFIEIQFNNPLDPTTISTGNSSVTFSSRGEGVFGCTSWNPTTASIAGITEGPLDTGASGWVHATGCLFGSRTITISHSGTIALSNGDKTVRFTVTTPGTCGSNCSVVGGATGNLVYNPPATLKDVSGQSMTGTFTKNGFMFF